MLNSTLLQNASEISQFESIPKALLVLPTIEFVINGAAIPLIAMIGVILNFPGILFLSIGPRKGQLYSLLLSTQLAFDTAFLVFEILRKLGEYGKLGTTQYLASYYVIITAGARGSLIASILMIVAIAHARMVAIKKPFKRNNIVLSWTEKRAIWMKYCIPIIIASILLTLPVLFEFEFSIEDDDDTDPLFNPSGLRLNALYSIFFIGILNFGILGVLPIAYLIYVLYKIKKELAKNEERLDHFRVQRNFRRRGAIQLETLEIDWTAVYADQSHMNQQQPLQGKQLKKIKSSKSMTKEILIFLALHTFRMITTVEELYFLLGPNKDYEASKRGDGIPIWISLTASLSELGLVLNSSLGLITYLNTDLMNLLRALSTWISKYLRCFKTNKDLNENLAMDKLDLDNRFAEMEQIIELLTMDKKTDNLHIGEDGITVATRDAVGAEDTEGPGKAEGRNSLAIVDEQINIERRSVDETKGSVEYRTEENTTKITIEYTLIDTKGHSVDHTNESDKSCKDENTYHLAINDNEISVRRSSFNNTQGIDKSH